jgi:hypothetical protein
MFMLIDLCIGTPCLQEPVAVVFAEVDADAPGAEDPAVVQQANAEDCHPQLYLRIRHGTWRALHVFERTMKVMRIYTLNHKIVQQ